MIWFTCCTHFYDARIELMNRPFKSVKEMNDTLYNRIVDRVAPDDTLYHLGDITCSKNLNDHFEALDQFIKPLPCRRILIKGNYDVLTDDIYKGYFNVVADEFILNCTDIGAKFALAHKPEDLPPTYFGICGHVHSAWRIQRNMINVCMDANHYQLVSLDQILKTYNAIKTYHDRNAFAGELEANKRTAPL